MVKRVILAGLLGGAVLLAWTFVANGVFGFKNRMDMKQIPNERLVYDVLKQNVVLPGRYTCNPAVTPDGGFPEGEPVFGVLSAGVGHEAAGRQMLLQTPLYFAAPLLAAWLLSLTSRRVLSSYLRKVLFFAGIGLLFALFGDLRAFEIGGYPWADALILAIHDVSLWTVVGLAAAGIIKPDPAGEANS